MSIRVDRGYYIEYAKTPEERKVEELERKVEELTEIVKSQSKLLEKFEGGETDV